MEAVFSSHGLSPILTSISALNSNNRPSYTLLHFPRISNPIFPSHSSLQSTTIVTNSKTFVPKSTTISCSQSQNNTPSRRRLEYIPNHIPDPNYIRIFDTILRDDEQSPGASMTSKEKIDIARQLAKLGVDIIEAGFPCFIFKVEFFGLANERSDREFLYQILGEVIKAGTTTLNIPDTVGITLPSEFGRLIADIKVNTPGIENVIISIHCQNDLGLSTANTIEGVRAGARQLEVTINGIGERAGNASLEALNLNLVLCD